MNLVDIFFLLIILVCGLIGLKRGFFKELVLTVGYIVLLIVSYKLITPTTNLIISLVKVGNKFTCISNNIFFNSILNIKCNFPINNILNKYIRKIT